MQEHSVEITLTHPEDVYKRQGKSVAVNGIISSILMKARPDEVKFMMVDPKMVELSVYNDIPHLLIPVVTNPRKASRALQKVVDEMENRYELFSKVGARNIAGFNAKVAEYNAQSEMKQVPLPLIVVIVDELADLMMVASKEVEAVSYTHLDRLSPKTL